MATIIVTVVLVLGALNGFRRGLLKETVATVGVLLGALLAQGWANRWTLFFTTTAAPQTYALVVRALTMSLLFGITILTGYGAGFLVGRLAGKLAMTHRASGALMGLLNWTLLSAFTLTFIQQLWYTPSGVAANANGEPLGGLSRPVPPAAAASWITKSPLTKLMVDRLGVGLLGIAVAVAVLSVVTAFLRLIQGSRQAATPAAVPSKPSAAPLPSIQSAAPAPRPTPAPAPTVSAGSASPQAPTTPMPSLGLDVARNAAAHGQSSSPQTGGAPPTGTGGSGAR